MIRPAPKDIRTAPFGGSVQVRINHDHESCDTSRQRSTYHPHGSEGMEGRMEAACYEIVRENDKWTICASGMKLIVCRDRRTALRTARRAMALLAPDQPDSRRTDAAKPATP